MAKRGSTDYSLVLAVNKPLGMSSHDVVNRVRSIFGERRVGHMGTLDPLASGVLPVCVGPATRLDAYFVNHDKTYRVRVEFGTETNTADSEGEVIDRGAPTESLFDASFAEAYVAGLVGKHEQVPPAYSAIKVNGKVAYKEARKGNEIEFAAREIEIYSAKLIGIVEADCADRVSWDIELSVSKGTYIRSIAVDMGRALGCPAHVSVLERVRVGRIDLADCVTLETLESLKEDACLDPVRLLGIRFAFVDALEGRIANGNFVKPGEVDLFMPYESMREDEACACSVTLVKSDVAPYDEETIALICNNKLKALYSYEARRGIFKPACIFSIGVDRG